MSDNIITLTPSALLHFKGQLTEHPDALGIRLGVKNAGCSGMAYTVDFAYKKADDDKVYIIEGCAFYLSPASVKVLKGMQIDRVEEGLNQYLKFNNPNATGTCGCGESFTVSKSKE